MSSSDTPIGSTTKVCPEMMVTVELKAVSCGTELRIVQEGIPSEIPDNG